MPNLSILLSPHTGITTRHQGTCSRLWCAQPHRPKPAHLDVRMVGNFRPRTSRPPTPAQRSSMKALTLVFETETALLARCLILDFREHVAYDFIDVAARSTSKPGRCQRSRAPTDMGIIAHSRRSSQHQAKHVAVRRDLSQCGDQVTSVT